MPELEVLVGIGLALGSSVLFAGQMILSYAALKKSTKPKTVLCLTTTLNFVLLVLWVVYSVPTFTYNQKTYLLCIIAGLFAPLLGRLFQIRGLASLGSNISTPILMTHPAITVILAVVLLNETPDWGILIGTILMIAGSIAISTETANASLKPPLGSLRMSRAIWFPVLGAIAYGISMVFRKAAITYGLNSSVAAVVTLLPSWLGYTLFYALRRDVEAFSCTKNVALLLLASSLFASAAAVMWFRAIEVSRLSVVAPLAATTPLFALILTRIWLRNGEVFSRRLICGTGLTTSGVALIAFRAA